MLSRMCEKASVAHGMSCVLIVLGGLSVALAVILFAGVQLSWSGKLGLFCFGIGEVMLSGLGIFFLMS